MHRAIILFFIIEEIHIRIYKSTRYMSFYSVSKACGIWSGGSAPCGPRGRGGCAKTQLELVVWPTFNRYPNLSPSEFNRHPKSCWTFGTTCIQRGFGTTCNKGGHLERGWVLGCGAEDRIRGSTFGDPRHPFICFRVPAQFE